MRIHKKLKVGLFLVAPVIAGLILAIPKLAHADVASSTINKDNSKFTFINGGTIVGDFGDAGKVAFVDNNITDSKHNYKPQSGGFVSQVILVTTTMV